MRGRNKSKLVRGVGINDADYAVYVYGRNEAGQQTKWQRPFYTAWTSMLKRCYGAHYLALRPTYNDCSVVAEWIRFSKFREWMTAQPWEGNQLDKDILLPGNKIYSPDLCVFVPSKLNSFFLGRGAARGEWPIGVNFHKQSGKFRAVCSNPFTGKGEYLGRFHRPDAAHEAWRAKKHEHACRYASQQTDPRIAQALRTRYAQGASQ